MSLSKRDTFVRWLDPLKIFWEDANGHTHLSIADALKVFEIEDTPENRKRMIKLARELMNPTADIEVRNAPDSEDYYKQKVPRCDHKFVDSKVCLKCGWNPDE